MHAAIDSGGQKANQWSNFNWRKPKAFRGHSRGIRGHSGSSKGIRVFSVLHGTRIPRFNPGWKYPLYNIKPGKEKLLAACGAKKHGCGASRILLEAI